MRPGCWGEGAELFTKLFNNFVSLLNHTFNWIVLSEGKINVIKMFDIITFMLTYNSDPTPNFFLNFLVWCTAPHKIFGVVHYVQ